MNLLNLIKEILGNQKKIDTKSLPSQGLFYKDDFEIYIKKADIGDIIEYEIGYDSEDIGNILSKLKRIVEKNIILPSGYSFIDVKSIDVVFLFLEIAKFTNNKPISLTYFNDEIGRDDTIEFGENSFNYFKIDNLHRYDKVEKNFDIDGYKYTLPSIGIENSITNFLISKQNTPNCGVYNEYKYDFINFLGFKNHLTFNEIDNLIQIFNFDIDESEIKKISKVCKKFHQLQRYTLKKGERIIDINSKIDLEKIWK
jgi:hypothetical protein